jgi:hypothetical protein
MKIHLAILLALAITFPLVAQEQKPAASKEPKTKIEVFEAKAGATIIRGFSTIGGIGPQYPGNEFEKSAWVEIRELIDASSGKSEYGIYITIKNGSERESSSYIDYDEIDSLIKGIDYVAKIEKSITKLDTFQADYTTRGDFIVSSFNDSNGNKLASLRSGYFASVSDNPLTMDQLAQFKLLIQQAKAKLDSIQPPDHETKP